MVDPRSYSAGRHVSPARPRSSGAACPSKPLPGPLRDGLELDLRHDRRGPRGVVTAITSKPRASRACAVDAIAGPPAEALARARRAAVPELSDRFLAADVGSSRRV
jgi:hypothetical protein